ncbi:MAG: crotonyl-CoA carboxylase/reductase [Ilumatobacteraceae bacterium]|jgi:crotonyl-CoA reductase|nr:crotonyl-CoA carboxylase/reductase [Ilumatobacteraceae bacterium]MBJ7368922.1 crotonyl-CoA carboxylase/reductase [Ilumatobacteraceae bacterium]
MDRIREAILNGATPDQLAAIALPDTYRAAHVLKAEQEMFTGMASNDKDPRRSVHVGDVPTPELAPDEAVVAVMASSINFNTVWTSIFEPISTFGPLARLGRESEWSKRHDRDYQVIGSDASGVVLRVGSAVRNWKPGDKVTVHCNHVDDQDPSSHDDSMMGSNQRIWGYETNFGGLADLCIVKANQLMPKPTHLSWEEAAVNALCNSTSYRMLVSRNGANMKQGDVVLIWGATGGIGAYAVQYVLNGGGIPVGVVSSPEKAQILRNMGCEAVIDRSAANYKFWNDDNTHNESEWRRLGKDIRELVGEDPDIVFEHPGRSTFGASMYVVKRGGVVVTCAATSGFMLEFDNRFFWMRLKRLIGSHFANYREAWDANRLVSKGMIHPVLSRVFTLENVGEAAYQVHHNMHEGKIGVLCLAPTEGLGIDDPELRAKVGEKNLTLFRR